MADRIETDEQGRRWLIGKHVDILMDPEPVRYAHDGHGRVLLTGGLLHRPVIVPMQRLAERIDLLWAKRQESLTKLEEVGDLGFFGVRPQWYEDVWASAVKSYEEAEMFNLDLLPSDC